MPVSTLRMWVLGIVFTILGSGINQFFSLRYPSVHIVALVAELLAYPLGVFLAKTLPLSTISLGRLGSFTINPDRKFNIKEHALIVIMSNVSFGFATADATNIIQAASKSFYNFQLKPGFYVMIVLCAQLLGFGVAGLSAPWLVEPARIIWPGVLSNCAMLETLHSRANTIANGWRISRLRFFLYVMGGAFVWYWFPGLIFTALSYFTWVCWIAPKNIVVNQLFGMQTGLGLSPITFDWSQVAYNTNPLLSPSWAAINVFFGFAFFFWIITPILYYTNTWFTAYLPMMTSDVYDNTGAVYDTSRVVGADNTLNVAAYRKYSPPFLGATFAFVYGLSFASITSVLSHIGIWHARDLWAAMKGRNKLDIHARLIRASYRKTPWYWYATIIVIIMAMAIAMVEVYETKLPVYGVFLGLIIPAIYMVPCGIIQGITNVDANQLNVLAEFIGGYMFEGKPLANMIFKILSTDVVGQGVYFAMDMKLAHYLKVPADYFRRAGHCDDPGCTHAGGCDDLDVGQYRWYLRVGPSGWIFLSQWPDCILVVRDLGSCWTAQTLLGRRDILSAASLLLDRGHCAFRDVGVVSLYQEALLEIDQLAFDFRRHIQCPSWYVLIPDFFHHL